MAANTAKCMISRRGDRYRLESEASVPAPIDEVFAFFSNAGNLDLLTPSFLRFRIVTPQPIPMHQGTLIDYRLRIHGVPIRWQSQITAWEPPVRFVDEQRRGPYLLWVHEHRFEEIAGARTSSTWSTTSRVAGGCCTRC